MVSLRILERYRAGLVDEKVYGMGKSSPRTLSPRLLDGHAVLDEAHNVEL